MAAALTVWSKFGFELQESGQGEVVGGDPIWLPFVNDLGFVRSSNPQVIELADNCNLDRLTCSRGKWWQGSVTLLVCPGSFSDLSDWIFTRDAYSQGYWATVWVRDGLGNVRTARDVKVASARFDFTPGSYVAVTLDLVGISDGSNLTPTDLTEPVTVAPYIFKDVTLQHNVVIGATDTGIRCRGTSFTVNNMLEDPAEGLRLNGSYGPATLYNTRMWSITGSIERDLLGTEMEIAANVQFEHSDYPTYDWNEQTYDGVMVLSLSRAGVDTTFTFNRIRYTEWASRITGARAGIQTESAQFIALTYWDAGESAWLDPVVVT